MDKKPLEKLSSLELCQEASRVRSDLEEKSEYLNEVYSHLYSVTRKSSADGMTYTYLSIANAGKRLAGVVYQASRRTSSTEIRSILAAEREVAIQKKSQESLDKRRKKAEEDKKVALEETVQRKASESGTKGAHHDPLEKLFGVPYVPSDPLEIDSIISSYDESSLSDVDDVYGEELD
jgi:hypothetical protein